MREGITEEWVTWSWGDRPFPECEVQDPEPESSPSEDAESEPQWTWLEIWPRACAAKDLGYLKKFVRKSGTERRWRLVGPFYPEGAIAFTEAEMGAFLEGLMLAHEARTGKDLLADAGVRWELAEED